MKNAKRFASLGLAVVLAASSINVPMSAYAAGTDKSTDDYQKIIESLDLSKAKEVTLDSLKGKRKGLKESDLLSEKAEKLSKYSDDEIVNVVVEVDSDSLVDSFKKSSAKSFEKYVDSSSAKTQQQKIRTAVEKVENSVTSKLTKDGKDFKVLFSYDTVFTGFSVEMPYGELKKVMKVKGVKNAFVSEKYDIPVTTAVDNEPNMVTSREMIEAGFVNDTGYNGEGMVVAVLDTGIDYNHNAFDPAKLEGVDVRETKASVGTTLEGVELDAEAAFTSKTGANFTAEDVYHTAKVPYGFDYTDIDTDPIPVHDENHGTHVSGTIVGNSDEVQGVARDAQVMIFKVFNDNGGGCVDSVLIAALDDAVKLNVDTINMSLGSSAGFSTDVNDTMQAVYDSVGAAGINLDVSAGNSYDSAYQNNFYNYALTTNPDAGIVGSPSTYASSLSVASVENTHLNFNSCFKVGDTNIGYNDSQSGDLAFTTLSGEYEFVHCGFGTPEEVAEAGDLTGKVALISRGDITFTEKVTNAEAAGAVAVIIYNNQAGTISMALEGVKVPAVSIVKEDGAEMLAALAAGNNKVTFDPELKASFVNPLAWTMSDFSSWGPTPSLELKPEITAPGGNIYSAYYVENGVSVNGNMSGTSMAAPHMTGASTLVKEYVKENWSKFSTKAYNALDAEMMVNLLLMSTSVPVIESADKSDDGLSSVYNYYSPRKQGSGVADLKAAVTTPSYITVAGCERPKAELGYNTTGTYTFDYTITNTSNEAVDYTLDGAVQIEDVAQLPSKDFVAYKTDINITGDGADIAFAVDGQSANEVTVPANGSKTVAVTVSLDKNSNTIKAYSSVYKNGFFVEGFVFANAKDASGVDLSVPYLGFYGDWAALDIFDADLYEAEADDSIIPNFSMNTRIGGSFVYGEDYLLGKNPFGSKDSKYVQDYIAISKNSEDGYATMINTNTYTLRGAGELTYTYKNSAGKVVKEAKFNKVAKSYYHASAGFVLCAEQLMEGSGDPTLYADEVPDGDYTLTISAKAAVANAKPQTKTYKIKVDTQAPVIDARAFEVNGKAYLYVNVTDNHYVGETVIGGQEFPAEDGLTEDALILSVPEATVQDLTKLKIGAYDYALNLGIASPEIFVLAPEADEEPETPVVEALKVTANNSAAGKVTVEWNKANDAEGYYVYRSTSKDGKFKLVDSLEKDATSYVDTSVSLSKNYYYKVSFFKTENGKRVEDGISDVVSVKVVKPGVTKISSVKRASSTKVKVSIKKFNNATGYVLYRSKTKNGSYKKVATLKASKTSYTDKIGKNKTYYYKVKVYYTTGGKTYTGSYSAPVKGSTRK